jgi:uncharacterized membrane protein YdcZ (DUF606 family)
VTIIKVLAGIVAGMFVVWGLLYPSGGRRGLVSPRFATTAAILVGVFLLVFVLWALLHP